MGSHLLFVTADIGVEVIEKFLSESSRARSQTSRQWLLVRSPDESVTGPPLSKAQDWYPDEYPDWPSIAPIEPFKTGFLNASVETLGKYVYDHAKDRSPPGAPNPESFHVSTTSFVVLDARSAKDDTVLVYQHHSRMPTEYLLEDEDAWDRKLAIHEWVQWRLKFRISYFWILAYEDAPDYADFEIKKGEYFDEHGVLQIPWFERSESNFPDLPDDEKAPFGPDVDEPEWKFAESPFIDLVEAGVIKTYPMP